MKTILVANQKGGCGKTTIATTLAAALAGRGERVALADADAQRAALTWLGQRPSRAPAILGLDWSRGASPAARREAAHGPLDRLIIDSAADGFLAGGAAALDRIDLVVAPVTPSRFDAQATLGFLARLESLRALRTERPALWLLANRLRKRQGPRGRIDPRLVVEIGGAADRLIEISDHARYAQLAGAGLSVFDADDPKIARLRAEWRELLDALAPRPPAPPLAAMATTPARAFRDLAIGALRRLGLAGGPIDAT